MCAAESSGLAEYSELPGALGPSCLALGPPCLACWAPFGFVQVDSRYNLAGISSVNMQNVTEIAEISRKSMKLMFSEAAKPSKSVVLPR